MKQDQITYSVEYQHDLVFDILNILAYAEVDETETKDVTTALTMLIQYVSENVEVNEMGANPKEEFNQETALNLLKQVFSGYNYHGDWFEDYAGQRVVLSSDDCLSCLDSNPDKVIDLCDWLALDMEESTSEASKFISENTIYSRDTRNMMRSIGMRLMES